MVRGALISSLVLVLSLSAARGQEKPPADWKWDAKKWSTAKPTEVAKKGDKRTREGHESDVKQQKVTEEGNEAKDEKSSYEVSFKYVQEILAVDDAGKPTKAKLAIERWVSQSSEGAADKSLEGKFVILEKNADGDLEKTVQDADGKGVAELSSPARQWLTTLWLERAPGDRKLDVLLPEKPLAPESEWSIDAQKLAAAMFGPKTKVDEKASKAAGKLTGVHMESGVAHGKMSIELDIKLTTVPGASGKWTEGGTFAMTIAYEGSLENKFDGAHAMKMTVDFGGKAEIEAGGKKGTLDMKIQQAKDEKQGRLER